MNKIKDGVKIALAMIVKDDTEAKQFKDTLDSVMDHVDGLFVAVTGPSGKHDKIHKLVKKYGGTSLSTTPETNPNIYSEIDGKFKFTHFAEARNVSFEMVPSEYDFVLWVDTDDVINHAEEIRQAAKLAKEKKLDSVFFTYWYDVKRNAKGEIVDVVITQLRERLLRNGKFKWISRVHEVAVTKDGTDPKNAGWTLADGRKCVWVHTLSKAHLEEALKRNSMILEMQIEEEEYKDPRTMFYLAKVYFDMNTEEYDGKALSLLTRYLDLSGWDAERSNALEYVGLIYERAGKLNLAEEAYLLAVKEYPDHIKSYLRLASVYFTMGKIGFGKKWLAIATTMELPDASTTMSNTSEIKLLTANLKYNEAIKDGDLKAQVKWAGIRHALLGGDDNGIYQRIKDHEYNNMAATGLFNYAKWLKDMNDISSIEKLLEAIPEPFLSLPFVSLIRNSIPGKEWEKNSIVYYASFGSPHFEKWGPESDKTGIGGSETAVINLAKKWAEKGKDVTVFCDIEEDTEAYGVKWINHNKINWNDTFNTLILWRSPHLIDKSNAKHLYMDLHDVASTTDWSEDRVKKIDKVFFKSQYHREFLPNIPDDKCVIISNGINI